VFYIIQGGSYRVKKKELARKITSWLTLGAFSVQPMLAFAEEILPDNNAPVAERPLVTETASGNPLVQITAPTAGGVSVNRYEFFNVPERGAILNNSYGLTSTELAGYVQGNPNLAAGTARIIVNEVTSANPSELRGFLEVAGDRAAMMRFLCTNLHASAGTPGRYSLTRTPPVLIIFSASLLCEDGTIISAPHGRIAAVFPQFFSVPASGAKSV